jgi:hypothetical protein
MAHPFGPIITDLNKDIRPIRKREAYKELAETLNAAICDLQLLSGDENGRYQAEEEALEAISIAAYKLMKYINTHAWR